MVVELSVFLMLLIVFLYNCVLNLKDGGFEDNSKFLYFLRKFLNELESFEKSGMLLNIVWMLWYDK